MVIFHSYVSLPEGACNMMVYDTFMILITFDTSNFTIKNYGSLILRNYLMTIVNWVYLYQLVSLGMLIA